MENSKVTTYLDLVPRVHRPPGHPPEVPGGLRGGRADVEHAAEGVHPGALRPPLGVAVAGGQDDPWSNIRAQPRMVVPRKRSMTKKTPLKEKPTGPVPSTQIVIRMFFFRPNSVYYTHAYIKQSVSLGKKHPNHNLGRRDWDNRFFF